MIIEDVLLERSKNEYFYSSYFVCFLLLLVVTGQWYYPGPLVSSTNKIDHQDNIAEIQFPPSIKLTTTVLQNDY
jgi:hypothetical protein